MQKSQKNYKFIISGSVQGVFYRKTVFEDALAHEINGYVKNLPDGSVEACATLDEEEYFIFLDILKKGSYLSIVDDVKIEVIEEQFMDGFEIRF